MVLDNLGLIIYFMIYFFSIAFIGKALDVELDVVLWTSVRFLIET